MSTEYPLPVGFGRQPVAEPGVVVTPSGAVMLKLGSGPPPDEEILPGYVAFSFAPGSFTVCMRANVGSEDSPDLVSSPLISD